MDWMTVMILILFAMLVMAISQAFYLVTIEIIESAREKKRRRKRWKDWMKYKERSNKLDI